LPLTMMVDCNPGSQSSGAIPLSITNATLALDGWFLIAGASSGATILARASQGGSQTTGSSLANFFAGSRHIATGVFTSNTSRQVFCDNQAGAVEATSKIPTGPQNRLTISGANQSAQFILPFIGPMSRVCLWSQALTFAEHIEVYRGTDPRSIRPSAIALYSDFAMVPLVTTNLISKPPRSIYLPITRNAISSPAFPTLVPSTSAGLPPLQIPRPPLRRLPAGPATRAFGTIIG
jgi:hypothetical protein